MELNQQSSCLCHRQHAGVTRVCVCVWVKASFLWVLESKLRSSYLGSKHSSPLSHRPSSVTFNKIKMFYGNQEIMSSLYKTRTAKIYQYFHFFNHGSEILCSMFFLYFFLFLKKSYLKVFRTEPSERFSHLNFGFLRLCVCVYEWVCMCVCFFKTFCSYYRISCVSINEFSGILTAIALDLESVGLDWPLHYVALSDPWIWYALGFSLTKWTTHKFYHIDS